MSSSQYPVIPANATSSRTEHVHSLLLLTRPDLPRPHLRLFLFSRVLPVPAPSLSVRKAKSPVAQSKTAIRPGDQKSTNGMPFLTVPCRPPQSPPPRPPSLPRRKREIHGERMRERIKGYAPRTTLEAVLNSRPWDYRDIVGRAQTWSQYIRTRHDSNAEKARVYLTGPCAAAVSDRGNQNGPFTDQ